MYCIYHSRDLDGWMSAAIVMKWHKNLNMKNDHGAQSSENLEIIGWDYGDDIPDLEPGRKVIMVDISFPMKEMMKIAKNANSDFIWIDHHKSAILDDLNYIGEQIPFQRVLPRYQSAILLGGKQEISDISLIGACELTWSHFFSGPIPEIVRLLGCYDSFRHKGTDESDKVFQFQYAARAFLTHPNNCYDVLQHHQKLVLTEWIMLGSGILQYLKIEAKSIYKDRREFTKGGLSYAAVNVSRFNPASYDIKYSEDLIDVFVCYHHLKDGRWTFSLYNDDGKVDVSVIAKQQGGGGHPGAAGFISTNLDFLK